MLGWPEAAAWGATVVPGGALVSQRHLLLLSESRLD